MQASFVSNVLPESGFKALLPSSAALSRIAICLLTVFCLFNSATACDNSYFQLDSVVFDGTYYTAHTTLCIGQGLTGSEIGAGGNTTLFAIGAFGQTGEIVGFSPSSYYNPQTNCTVQGNLVTNPAVGAGGSGYDPNSMVEFVPVNGCDFACFFNNQVCGDTGSICLKIDILMNDLPDSLVGLGVEGTGLLFNGCHRFSHGGFATNDMTIPWWAFPVEWGAFEANKTPAGIRLNWETLKEEGNDHFRVLRSSDGLNWERIGLINAKGNTESSTHYEYLDRSPVLGTNHYRIVQVDREGSQTATEVRTVTVPLPTGLALRAVGPVPAREVLHLELDADRASALSVELYDLKGQLHQSQIFSSEVGSNEWSLDVADLQRGYYLLLVHGQGEVFRRKVMLH